MSLRLAGYPKTPGFDVQFGSISTWVVRLAALGVWFVPRAESR